MRLTQSRLEDCVLNELQECLLNGNREHRSPSTMSDSSLHLIGLTRNVYPCMYTHTRTHTCLHACTHVNVSSIQELISASVCMHECVCVCVYYSVFLCVIPCPCASGGLSCVKYLYIHYNVHRSTDDN